MAKKILFHLISLSLVFTLLINTEASSGTELAPKSKFGDSASQTRMRKDYIRAILRIAKKKSAMGRYDLLTNPDFLKLLFTDFIASIPPVDLKERKTLFTSTEIEFFVHSLNWPEWIQWLIFLFDVDTHFDAHFQPKKNLYRWLAFLHISKEIIFHLLPVGLTTVFIVMAAIGQTWALGLIPFVIYFYWAGFLMDRMPTYRNFISYKQNLGITLRSGKTFLLIKEKCIKMDLSSLDLISVILHEFCHVLPGWRETHLQDFFAFCYLALLEVPDIMKIDPLSWKIGKEISDHFYSKAASPSDFIVLYAPVIEEIRSLLIEKNRDESISVPESFLSDFSDKEPYSFNVALASFVCHRYYRMKAIFGKEKAEEDFIQQIMAFRAKLLEKPKSDLVPANNTDVSARARMMDSLPAIEPVSIHKLDLFDLAA